MKTNENKMNWRMLKIIGIGFGVFFLLLLALSWASEKLDNNVGDQLQHLVAIGNMLFAGSVGIVGAYIIIKLFFKNTLGNVTGEDVDRIFEEFSQTEKVRWVLGALLVIFLGLTNTSNGAGLKVSQKGVDLIIYYEVGGRSYYARHLERPTVPAWRTTQSGVTVGVGYDCGYNTKAQIKADWGDVLRPSQLRALQSVSGLKGTRAYYASKRIKHLISISYADAEKVFRRSSLTRFSDLTSRTLALDKYVQHPHSNGALVSLIFNRGASMRGDRRREMRWIKYNLSIGRADRVPRDIRSMKRIWSATRLRGLHLRRDAEAKLFQQGLDAK